MRRAGGMQHAGAQIRHVRDDRSHLQAVHKLRSRLAAALDAEGDDAAGTVRHILLRKRIVRAALQAGVVDPGDALVRLKEFCDGQRVRAVALHAQRERLHAEVQQERVHRRSLRA